uniref:Uncharacterized protein n=1 Tax=CrAss-like virus sp. ctXt06 TaxID=2825837 RepID=A0A8S5V6T0_9CAUD|nr:MAG TPA: hypothetical protein [CrAss-like virus sp. ctXt06]
MLNKMCYNVSLLMNKKKSNSSSRTSYSSQC